MVSFELTYAPQIMQPSSSFTSIVAIIFNINK